MRTPTSTTSSAFLLFIFAHSFVNLAAAEDEPTLSFYSSVMDEELSWMRLALTTAMTDGTSTTEFITDQDIGSAWKPIPSLDNTKLVFFNSPNDVDYTTPNQIAVINVDGGNLKRLTDLKLPDWNPNWMRDGSNRITFFRFGVTSPNGVELPISIWLTSSEWEEGQEVMLTTDQHVMESFAIGRGGYEWAFDSFEDGSILALKFSDHPDFPDPKSQPCLLTFDESNNYTTTYNDITLEDGIEWNTEVGYMFVSSSQKYITYLKGRGSTYGVDTEPLLGILCFAEIDLEETIIRNEECVVQNEERNFIWYGKMNQDEDKILYVMADTAPTAASPFGGQGRVYAYDLAAKTTTPVSTVDDPHWHRYISPVHYNVAPKPSAAVDSRFALSAPMWIMVAGLVMPLIV